MQGRGPETGVRRGETGGLAGFAQSRDLQGYGRAGAISGSEKFVENLVAEEGFEPPTQGL